MGGVVLAGVAALLLIAGAGWYVARRLMGPQETRAAAAKSAIEIDAVARDFGDVLQSQMELEHTFHLVNRGREPVDLAVKGVACSCLELQFPPSIAPGETVDCRARLTLGGREGALDVPAVLSTSEPGAPGVVLSVRCNIIPDVRIVPSQLEFHDVRSGTELSAEVEVITSGSSAQGKPAAEVRATSKREGVTCELVDTSRPVGLFNQLQRTAHRFRVRVDTNRLSREQTRVHLSDAVSFACPQGSETISRPLPVLLEFRRHDHLAGPRTITLRKSRAAVQTIPLRSIDDEPFVLTGARSTAPDVLAQTGPQESAVTQALTVKLAPPPSAPTDGAATSGVQKCRLSVLTDRWPDEPYEIEVLVLP